MKAWIWRWPQSLLSIGQVRNSSGVTEYPICEVDVSRCVSFAFTVRLCVTSPTCIDTFAVTTAATETSTGSTTAVLNPGTVTVTRYVDGGIYGMR